jgi:hypothetical protein
MMAAVLRRSGFDYVGITSGVAQVADDLFARRQVVRVGPSADIARLRDDYFCFANGLATSCAQSMTSCAAGLGVRFLSVTMKMGFS